jgi:hypothetical protein
MVMITKEKINGIKRKLKKGEPQGEIKEQLRSEGYSEEDIDKVFLPHIYDMRSWYLSFGVIISCFGIFLWAKNGSLLILILGLLLLGAYLREIKRQK